MLCLNLLLHQNASITLMLPHPGLWKVHGRVTGSDAQLSRNVLHKLIAVNLPQTSMLLISLCSSLSSKCDLPKLCHRILVLLLGSGGMYCVLCNMSRKMLF